MAWRPVTRIRARRPWTATQVLRTLTQIFFLGLVAYGVIRHRINETAGLSGPRNDAPSVDSLSPFGGLETLWTWLTTGEILKHLHLSDLVLLLASVLVGLLLGGAFCGWICPFGALQEWLYRLRTRFIPYQVNIPPKVDQILKHGRYLVLVVVLYFSWSLGQFVFGDYCPWKALWHLGSDELAFSGIAVLGLVGLSGLLFERSFCKYACPLGAFLGLANKLAPLKLARTDSACKSCQLCSRQCPMNIDIVAVSQVTDTTCTRCLECVDACPVHDTLEVKAGRRSIPGWIYGATAVAIFIGVIGLAMVTENWEASASAAPPPVEQITGLPAPDDLKGWRTLQEVVEIWKLPAEVLYRETGLDPDNVPLSRALKELEAVTPNSPVVVDRELVSEIIRKYRAGEIK